MGFVLEFFLASLGPWLAKKLLQPEVVMQLGYDLVEEIWQKKNPDKPLPKGITDARDFLQLK